MSVYDSLADLGPRDIRLLKIPSKKVASSPGFECSLVVVSLHKAPGYAALSYAWGESSPVEKIDCNGHTLNVRPNLLSTLTTIQKLSTDNSQYLWVDAICIDQSNLPERSAQVSIMKEIYSNAQVVFVRLGEHDQGLHCAVELIKKLNTAAVLRKDKPHLKTIEIAKRADLPLVETDHAWTDLYSLFFNRPWFSRIWTIQELCHARECLILNGGLTMEWEDMANIAPIFTDYQYSIPGRSSVYWLQHFSRVRLNHSLNKPRCLLDLLQTFRGQMASDPRDKVYAVLNLSTSRAASLVTVDYSLTTLEVYKNAARSVILADTPDEPILDLLCATHPIKHPDGPSWVPDWSQRLNTLAAFDGDKSKTYCAAKGSVATVSICPNQEKLDVLGFRFDYVEVAALAMVLNPGYTPWNSLRSNPAAQHVLAEWMFLVLGMPTYPTGERIDDVLCKTLVAGKNFNGTFPMSDDDFDDFFRSYVDLRTKLMKLTQRCRFQRRQPGEYYDDLVFREPSLYLTRVEILSYFRRLIITRNGYIGLASCTTEPNDSICILFGAQTPFVLRQECDDWILLGECYIHGMMDGKAFDQPGIKCQQFCIR